MVVDDDLIVRDVVRRYLERDGHRVSLADNGEDALCWVEVHQPDLVVLDLMLPGMDGFEVCRRLRRAHTPPAPVGPRELVDGDVLPRAAAGQGLGLELR